ncbi:hypothetical protein [Comamonas odontotermitis]|nr:hypothetical protein [Comamonas odontotermitis]
MIQAKYRLGLLFLQCTGSESFFTLVTRFSAAISASVKYTHKFSKDLESLNLCRSVQLMNNKKFLAAIIILAIFSTLFFIFRICNIFLIEPPLASIATDGLQSFESNKLSSSSRKNPADDLVLQAKRKEIFAYSRDGNFKNTRNRLKNAWDAGVINQKEYYGELAHMLSVSVENPESIVREVVTSRGFVAQIRAAAVVGSDDE